VIIASRLGSRLLVLAAISFAVPLCDADLPSALASGLLTLVKALPQARNHSGRVMHGCIQGAKVRTNN
jgi:hypothetical protein